MTKDPVTLDSRQALELCHVAVGLMSYRERLVLLRKQFPDMYWWNETDESGDWVFKFRPWVDDEERKRNDPNDE